MTGWQTSSFGEIGSTREAALFPPGWLPLRLHFGITSFGVHAWQAAQAGDELLSEHDQVLTGHEELWIVVQGAARCMLNNQTLTAPAGTLIHISDPGVRRAAVASEPETIILTVEGAPGASYQPPAWEHLPELAQLRRQGRHEEVLSRGSDLLVTTAATWPVLFHMACAAAAMGDRHQSLTYLRRSAELEPVSVRLYARLEPTLADLIDDLELASETTRRPS